MTDRAAGNLANANTWALEGELRQMGPAELRQAVHGATQRAHDLANRLTVWHLLADAVIDYLERDVAALVEGGCDPDEAERLISDLRAAVVGT